MRYALTAAAVLVLATATSVELRWSNGRPVGSELANSERGVVPAVATRPMIAVLPLENLNSEPGSDDFADGLTDEIIRNLAVIDGLEVRSRTSSFGFKDKPRNLADVGAQLHANLVVEGSVLRAGSRLRINAQLVEISGDTPLWCESGSIGSSPTSLPSRTRSRAPS